jgi:heat shock 70kDa protein 4
MRVCSDGATLRRLQVSFTAKNRQLGTDAVGSLTVNPKNTVSQLKRLLGKRFQDPQVQADIKQLPYKVRAGGALACSQRARLQCSA